MSNKKRELLGQLQNQLFSNKDVLSSFPQSQSPFELSSSALVFVVWSFCELIKHKILGKVTHTQSSQVDIELGQSLGQTKPQLEPGRLSSIGLAQACLPSVSQSWSLDRRQLSVLWLVAAYVSSWSAMVCRNLRDTILANWQNVQHSHNCSAYQTSNDTDPTRSNPCGARARPTLCPIRWPLASESLFAQLAHVVLLTDLTKVIHWPALPHFGQLLSPVESAKQRCRRPVEPICSRLIKQSLPFQCLFLANTWDFEKLQSANEQSKHCK